MLHSLAVGLLYAWASSLLQCHDDCPEAGTDSKALAATARLILCRHAAVPWLEARLGQRQISWLAWTGQFIVRCPSELHHSMRGTRADPHDTFLAIGNQSSPCTE